MGRAIRTPAGSPARDFSPFLLLFLVLLVGPWSDAYSQSGNQPPAISGVPPAYASVGQYYSFRPDVVDPDGPTISFAAFGLPAWASFDTATGSISGVPTPSDLGESSVFLAVTDSKASDVLPAFTITVVDAKSQSEYQQDPGTLLVMEAERFQTNEGGNGVGPWQVVPAGNASSGKALKAPGGTFTGAPDTAVSEYRANFLVSGKYHLWVRFRAFDSASDSMYVELDSGGAVQVNPSANSGAWEWRRALADLKIAAGPHAVKLYRRESKLEVDRLLFTRNADFSPTGIGPAESLLIAPADDGIFQQSVSGMLAMEAEHFDSNVGGNSATPWAVITQPDASNQQAIKAPAGTFTGSPDTAKSEYRAKFAGSGTHYLWLRVRAFNSGSDSLYVEVDNNGPQQVNPATRNGEWEWKRLSGGLVITAGEHALKLYRRESNLEVDRLVVSTSASYVPSGEGPAESPRTAAGGSAPPSPNLPPSISGTPGTVAAVGQSYVFKPAASDPEGSQLSFGIKGRPGWATFSAVTGRLAGTPDQGDTGTYSNIAITVTDGQNTVQLPAFNIQVVGQATGGFSLSWDPPLANTDGSTLTDLAGYRIYRGTQPGQYSQVVNIRNASVTSFVFDQLSLGTTQFIAMTSVDTAGNESEPSAELSTLLR